MDVAIHPLRLLPPTWVTLPLVRAGGGKGGEEGVAEQVEVQVEVGGEGWVGSEQHEKECLTLTVTVGSVRNLPAGLLSEEVPMTSRPGTAAVKAKVGGDGGCISYEVPLGGGELRRVYSDRLSVRPVTEEERAQAMDVRGRWDDAREAEAQAAVAAAAAQRDAAAAAAQAQTARKGGERPASPRPSPDPAPLPAPLPPQQPQLSNAALVAEHALTTFLTPLALAPLSSLIDSSLFHLHFSLPNTSSSSSPLTGLAPVDLGHLAHPGITRVEGWWAMTQLNLPTPSLPPATDPSKKSAPAKPASATRKKDGGAADSASDPSLPSLDACRTCVWVAVELSRPLIPTPPIPPIADLLPLPPLTEQSLLSALFPPSLAFLSSPPPSLIGPLRAALAPLLSLSSPPLSPSSLPHLARRLSPLLARFLHSLPLPSPSPHPHPGRLRAEIYAHLMREVRRWQEAQGEEVAGEQGKGRGGRGARVREAVVRWGGLAREAEGMGDLALARLHHERRITAATGWVEERAQAGGGAEEEEGQAALTSALYDYAAFALRRAEREHAEISLRKALRLSPSHVPSLLLLATLLLDGGSLREADTLLKASRVERGKPLVEAVWLLLCEEAEEDEERDALLAAINPTLPSLPPSHPPSPSALTSAALSSLPYSQLGWSLDASSSLPLIGARYALAMRLHRAAQVWLRGALHPDDVRGVEEEKEGGREGGEGRGGRSLSRYGGWLHWALLLHERGEVEAAVGHAGRVVRALGWLEQGGVDRVVEQWGVEVVMYFLTRLGGIMEGGRRVDECEGLLMAYAALIPAHPALPLHLPSIGLLVHLLLARQDRRGAITLLSSLLALPSPFPTSAWLHLWYAEALYADAQYGQALTQCSAASLREPSSGRVYAQLSAIHCRLWKAKQTQRQRVEAAEHRAHRRPPYPLTSPTSPPSAPFVPSVHLRSLMASEEAHRSSARGHFQHFVRLVGATPLPVGAASHRLLVEMGMAWYEREGWDEAEAVWRLAEGMEGREGVAAGMATERLAWARAKREGVAVQGEEQARLIQGLFRKAKLRKERGEREQKEVVRIIHKPSIAHSGATRIVAVD